MNKQPFYHEVTILFTATRELPEQVVLEHAKQAIESIRGVVKDTVQIDSLDAEPGDPQDLVQ